MGKGNFAASLFGIKGNDKRVVTLQQVRRSRAAVPLVLRKQIRDPQLEAWFQKEAASRLESLPRMFDGEESNKTIQAALEMSNRYPDGSMRPISLDELLQMSDLVVSAKDILDRAQQGVELLKDNPRSQELGTVARGIPVGGASSRAAKWARQNPETALRFGIAEDTPRFLYRVGGRSLAQITLDFSQNIARSLGRIFPNVIMTNSEIAAQLIEMIRADLGNWKPGELANSILFNQIVMPRMWIKDQEVIKGKLYPAGHGDFAYLFAKYNIAKTLRDWGVKYFIFSNADEWLWQADPVMISIAQQLFDQGHHMAIIGVENINNQFGGGFVKKQDGTQSLVETPRLPWEVVQEGKAPIALNTTFYICDVKYLAGHQAELMGVEKSLAVKEVPGRQEGAVEQIFGVDSWAGDIFSAVLNPAFIQWPRLNFLGIKDGSFISGSKPVAGIGDRTYTHYTNESAAVFPHIMSRLMAGNKTIAEYLKRTGYSYLEPRLK